MTEVTVTMKHVRQACMCSRGARTFFQRYGLDWQTFLKQGLPASVIAATGDAMALQVVEVAREQGR